MEVTASGIGQYLEAADGATKAVLEAYPDFMELIVSVSQLWAEEVYAGEIPLDTLSGVPFLQSMMLWCSGVRVALSGHAIAAFPVLRTSIEAASYAYLMARSEALRDIWLYRERSPADLKAVKRYLGQAVADTAKALDGVDEGFGEHLRAIYETSITYGGHPNSHFAMQHMRPVGETEESWLFNHDCIAGPESPNTIRGIIAAIEIGLAASLLCALAVVDHPNIDRIRRIHRGLYDLKNNLIDANLRDVSGEVTE